MTRQGAARHALKDRGDDFYETPTVCVTSALRAGVFEPRGYFWRSGRIWEPCAGRGAIARILEKTGYDVAKTDLVAWPGTDSGIETPIDFLLERSPPKDVTTIITNPPFKLADQFIRHGLSLNLRVIVLLRAVAIEGAGRSDLIDRHLRTYWVGINRPPAMHREGWQGDKIATSSVPFAWFDFAPTARRPGQGITLRRLWWRGE